MSATQGTMSPWQKTVSQVTFPILRGPLAGQRWLLNTGSVYFLGAYEQQQMQAFISLLRVGLTVFDVGANIGYYTLTASRFVGYTGKVFAFEPLPYNLLRLRTHLRANKCINVTIVEAAVADRPGTACFEDRCSPGTAHLSPQGELTVNVVTLDSVVANCNVPLPDVMKIDVEGAEIEVLQGASTIFASVRPPILLSTHGEQKEQGCRDILGRLGYELLPLRENRFQIPATRRKEFLAVSE